MFGFGDKNKKAGFWILCAASLILAQIDLVFLFFVVPLHLIYRRWGPREFFIAAGIVMAGIAVRAGFGLRLMENRELKNLFLAAEIGFPLMVLTGVFLLIGSDLVKMRGIFRLLTAVAAAGLLSLFIFPKFFYNDDLAALIQDQIRQMGQMFKTGNTIEGGFDDALVEDYFSGPEVFENMRDVFFRTFMTGFTLVLLFLWRLGESVLANLDRRKPPGLKNFQVPRELLWPVLICWFLILLETMIPLGVFRYFIWNAGLVLLLLYGFQGISLLQFLMDRFKLPRGLRLLVTLILISLLLRPGFNVFVMIVVPGLGISETWIRYRNI